MNSKERKEASKTNKEILQFIKDMVENATICRVAEWNPDEIKVMFVWEMQHPLNPNMKFPYRLDILRDTDGDFIIHFYNHAENQEYRWVNLPREDCELKLSQILSEGDIQALRARYRLVADEEENKGDASAIIK